MQESTPKIPDPSEALPELLVQGGPGDELRTAGRNPVQSLRQPHVYVESHGRGGQDRHRPVIERHGVFAEALEILLTQADRRRPEDTLVRLLRKPDVKGGDEMVLNLHGPPLFHDAQFSS